MIEPDTIKLLRECDSGIKMGVKSIDDVLDRVKNHDLQQLLNACKDEHVKLDKELQQLLGQYEDEGKDPNFMAEQDVYKRQLPAYPNGLCFLKFRPFLFFDKFL